MAKYFRGESNFNAHYEVELKELPPLKRAASLLLFVLWIPFAVFLFIPDMFRLGVAGLIAWGGIYIPAVCLYVIPNMRGRRVVVPCILIAIGLLGEAGYLLISSYLENHEFTIDILAAICGAVLFLGFFIPGVCMLVCGIKRNKKWKTYNRTVMATVVDYKKTRCGIPAENVSGVNTYMNTTVVFSPIIQYYIDGKAYMGEIDSYFGRGQVPPVGQQTEIHVNPVNPNDFVMTMQPRGMLIAGGISFIAVGLFAVILSAMMIIII